MNEAINYRYTTIQELRRGDRIVYTSETDEGIRAFGIEVFGRGPIVHAFEMKDMPKLRSVHHLTGRELAHHAVLQCMRAEDGSLTQELRRGLEPILTAVERVPHSFADEMPPMNGGLIFDTDLRVKDSSWWVTFGGDE
jgi:hypothetical protein